MTSMNAPDANPQLMLLPGGTTPGAVTMTYSAVHKLWELYERFERTGVQRKERIILAPLEPAKAMPAVAAQTNVKLQRQIKQLPDSVDVILETSGSTTGAPRLVGLSYAALVASARATHQVLGGPGRWIVALPVHHVAGLQTLLRSCVAEASPIIADMSSGFDGQALLRACRTGADDSSRTYLSLVPKQLQDALDYADALVAELARLDAVLVGGSSVGEEVLTKARAAGINVVTTYGMSETSGGCVYNNAPLPGVKVRSVEGMIQIAGPVLMDAYLDGTDQPFTLEGDERWLRTCDVGQWDGQTLRVLGRADDVIISGGVNITPGPVQETIANLSEVQDVAVVSLPDSTWGEVVAAAIVASDVKKSVETGGTQSAALENESLERFAAKVRNAVGDKLGRAHAPRVIALLDALPTTDLGKPDRTAIIQLLHDLVASKRAWVR